MTSSLSITNIYLFNKDEKLVNYKNINDIMNDFINTRMEYYEIRKNYQIEKMENVKNVQTPGRDIFEKLKSPVVFE